MLKLKVCSAKLTRDTEIFGKMDPFVELEIAGFALKKTDAK